MDSTFKEITGELISMDETNKTLDNISISDAKEKVPDIKIWGDGDLFKLLSKASSKEENWMKSTKAMEIGGIGCIVQVTTQQNNQIAEALTFVPNTRIEEIKNDKDEVISRYLTYNKRF